MAKREIKTSLFTLQMASPVPTQTKYLPDQTAQYVLVAVSLLLIIGFWVWIMYSFKQTAPTAAVYLKCGKGLCATNIYNGEKRCPQNDNIALAYSPAYETCNSKTTCESTLTPYALLSDGSTNELGACESGQTCRCLAKPQCPIETMVIFQLANGDTYLRNSATSRALFVQAPISFQGNTGQPFTFDDPNTQFCAIKSYHLDRIAPGACRFAIPDNPSLSEIRSCLNANPCMVGVLAFHPANISTFNLSSTAITTVPVACVTGKPVCPSTAISVWDRSKAALTCLDVPL